MTSLRFSVFASRAAAWQSALTGEHPFPIEARSARPYTYAAESYSETQQTASFYIVYHLTSTSR
ncbi:MAG: hypothetical protein ACYCXH_07695, partial [Bellilinea sp.]